MNIKPLISIIIPAYNSEKTLSRLVDSIKMQTYSNWEVLIINDGSTDCTEEIAKSYVLTSNNIGLFTTANLGVSHARNIGIAKAKGDFFLFADSDDYLPATALATYVTYLKTFPQSDILVGSYNFRTNILQKSYHYANFQELADAFPLLWNNWIVQPVWNKLWRRQSLCIVFEENLQAGEDIIFSLKNLSTAHGITILPEEVYYYSGQKPHSLSNHYIVDSLNFVKTVRNIIFTTLPYTGAIKTTMDGYFIYFLIRNLKRMFLAPCSREAILADITAILKDEEFTQLPLKHYSISPVILKLWNYFLLGDAEKIYIALKNENIKF